jgi:uncharacterized membrane protein YkvA (DUF1232 family)
MRRLQTKAAAIRADTYALYLASRDPRVPWYAKAVAGLVVAYALSPLDLIPDFIPVLGYLDDLILIPLGLALALKVIPPAVLEEHRATARARPPVSRAGVVIVVGIWIAAAGLLGAVAYRSLR